MKKLKDICSLLRIKHYIKNLAIIVPAFFGGLVGDAHKMRMGLLGVCAFSAVSSAVYILNDLCDIEKDKIHPRKRNRPLASGRISRKGAIFTIVICIGLAIGLSLGCKIYGGGILALYFILNILYSKSLKNKPLVDVVLLASFYVIRVYYGAVVMGVEISTWLFLLVLVGSLFMGLGKRRNELLEQGDTREVLKQYTPSFLDKNMYVCVALADVFYALWAMDSARSDMRITVPIFIVILMKYSMDLETYAEGDPIEVIFRDKCLIALVIVYVVMVTLEIYII